ncbi:adenylate kinase [Sulfobacillus thermosulfidooxidans]|uniref:adenylate kinase n=1 Tax=Sulfobacillus thermosulfidooxidans TaxID=28034 RepID=UPI00047465C2|nr:adenylate kinase [Sulfobacillus thermosulfidooxidans]
MNMVLLGAPGAGKGTQAKRLAEYYSIPHISTGDIFRRNLSEGTPLGKRAQSYMSEGRLVPDDITEAMVDDRLQQADTHNGFILDGFPRNVHQADALARMLADRQLSLTAVIYIEVPHDILVERLVGRRVCSTCGTTFHVIFDPPAVEGVCEVCGGTLVQRPDDQPETVETRLNVYREETAPLIDFYRERGLLVEIDGTEPVDVVTQNIIIRLGAQHD